MKKLLTILLLVLVTSIQAQVCPVLNIQTEGTFISTEDKKDVIKLDIKGRLATIDYKGKKEVTQINDLGFKNIQGKAYIFLDVDFNYEKLTLIVGYKPNDDIYIITGIVTDNRGDKSYELTKYKFKT
jgi:hypothetical protein